MHCISIADAHCRDMSPLVNLVRGAKGHRADA
jgi:hypothetical protein